MFHTHHSYAHTYKHTHPATRSLSDGSTTPTTTGRPRCVSDRYVAESISGTRGSFTSSTHAPTGSCVCRVCVQLVGGIARAPSHNACCVCPPAPQAKTYGTTPHTIAHCLKTTYTRTHAPPQSHHHTPGIPDPSPPATVAGPRQQSACPCPHQMTIQSSGCPGV